MLHNRHYRDSLSCTGSKVRLHFHTYTVENCYHPVSPQDFREHTCIESDWKTLEVISLIWFSAPAYSWISRFSFHCRKKDCSFKKKKTTTKAGRDENLHISSSERESVRWHLFRSVFRHRLFHNAWVSFYCMNAWVQIKCNTHKKWHVVQLSHKHERENVERESGK